MKTYKRFDADGDGDWWLKEKDEYGRYQYTHDHLGDATEHLDKLQDEFWGLHAEAVTTKKQRDHLIRLLARAAARIDPWSDRMLQAEVEQTLRLWGE